MTIFELLTLVGRLTQAIDDSVDWFLLSRQQRDLDKREVYEAIYEAKNRIYLRVLKEVHAKLNG